MLCIFNLHLTSLLILCLSIWQSLNFAFISVDSALVWVLYLAISALVEWLISISGAQPNLFPLKSWLLGDWALQLCCHLSGISMGCLYSFLEGCLKTIRKKHSGPAMLSCYNRNVDPRNGIHSHSLGKWKPEGENRNLLSELISIEDFWRLFFFLLLHSVDEA